MADVSKTTTPRITRRQAIVIGALALVLVGTVIAQLGGNHSALAKAGVNAAPTAAQNATALPNGPASKVIWPQVSLDEMLRHNPFAEPASPVPVKVEIPALVVATPPTGDLMTASDSEKEEEQLSEQRRQKVNAALAALRSDKVTMILRTDRKVSAMIGNRLVREGDIVDGVRIVSIQTNGVLVEPADVD